jgi:predicted acetyltransferase
MHNYISKLDSERFGFIVAKLSGNIEKPELIIKGLKEFSTRLVIARIDFTNINVINQLERIGFIYKDAQITFNFNLKNNLPEINHNQFSLVPFNVKQIPELIAITKRSFINYGHYFADERLDKNKCSEIYIDWIKRCCETNETADEIIVAEKDNIVIGYLAIKKHYTNNEKYIAGVIGAVSPEHRNMGVFRAINIESLHLASKMGIDRVENNVLVTNFPVMKTYTSLGYNILRSEITMHYWYE